MVCRRINVQGRHAWVETYFSRPGRAKPICTSLWREEGKNGEKADQEDSCRAQHREPGHGLSADAFRLRHEERNQLQRHQTQNILQLIGTMAFALFSRAPNNGSTPFRAPGVSHDLGGFVLVLVSSPKSLQPSPQSPR